MIRPIRRLAACLSAVVLAAPAAAHDGMALGGTLHRLLHVVGTDTLVALGGVAIVVVTAAWLARAARRAARRAPR